MAINQTVMSCVLKPGASGSEVESLQKRLNVLSPPEVALVTDGHYGRRAQRLVEAFQKRHHLPQTGAVDQATSQALQNAKPYVAKPGIAWHREWRALNPNFAASLRKLLLTSEYVYGHELILTSVFRSPNKAQLLHIAHMVYYNGFASRKPKHHEPLAPHRIAFQRLEDAGLARAGWPGVEWQDFLADASGKTPVLGVNGWVTRPDEKQTRAKAFGVLRKNNVHNDRAGRAHAAQVAPGLDDCAEPCGCGGRCSRHCIGKAVDIAGLAREDTRHPASLEQVLAAKGDMPLDSFLQSFHLHRPLWTSHSHNEYWHVEPIGA